MRLLLIVFAAAAAHAFAACPVWLNSGNAADQASSLPYLSISAPAGGTPVNPQQPGGLQR
jgi:hypothetical protein